MAGLQEGALDCHKSCVSVSGSLTRSNSSRIPCPGSGWCVLNRIDMYSQQRTCKKSVRLLKDPFAFWSHAKTALYRTSFVFGSSWCLLFEMRIFFCFNIRRLACWHCRSVRAQVSSFLWHQTRQETALYKVSLHPSIVPYCRPKGISQITTSTWKLRP